MPVLRKRAHDCTTIDQQKSKRGKTSTLIHQNIYNIDRACNYDENNSDLAVGLLYDAINDCTARTPATAERLYTDHAGRVQWQ